MNVSNHAAGTPWPPAYVTFHIYMGLSLSLSVFLCPQRGRGDNGLCLRCAIGWF